MSNLPAAEKVGQAWRLHRDGDNQGAARAFEDIIASHPDSVDALYGLGLTRKATGDFAAAAAAFQQALDTSERAVAALKVTAQAEGQLGDNDLESNADDRYMMLTRMLEQRLADVRAPSA